MSIEELSINHDYYCSDSNYFSNEPGGVYDTFADFYEEYHDADIDMNLIFRWDITKRENSNRYTAFIFMIHQRKGIYAPHRVNYIDEQDVPKFIELMGRHWEKLVSIWRPISKIE